MQMMTTEHDHATSESEPFASLFGWWGAGGNRAAKAGLKNIRQLTADLQQAFSEAYSDEIKTLSAANDRVSRSFQGFRESRRPEEFLAAQMDLFTTLMENASHQIKTWSAFGTKVQGYCAVATREAAEAMTNRSREIAAKAEEPASRRSAR